MSTRSCEIQARQQLIAGSGYRRSGGNAVAGEATEVCRITLQNCSQPFLL